VAESAEYAGDQPGLCASPRVVGAATLDLLVNEAAGAIPDIVSP